jgi:two-component system CheB/CheR fusion protein
MKNGKDGLRLSEREREILLLAAEGQTDKQIARDLDISESTISTHWTRMREKTKCANRAQLIGKAVVSIYRGTAEELQRTTQLYGILVDTLTDFAVFVTDLDRKIVSWNPGVERIIGYTEEEWLGQSADIIFTEEDVQDRQPQLEADTAAQEGRSEDVRWHLRKDGSRFWANGVLVSLRKDGKLVGFAKVVQDNTYCKNMEDELRRLRRSLDVHSAHSN